MEPRICFGQQPCGFFPKRFLYAKVVTARRLQSELGGEIVFFFHDSDHDCRETQTVLRNRRTGEPVQLNFAFVNKLQRKATPLYLKRIADGWQANTGRQLPAYVDRTLVDKFLGVRAGNVADFCLDMYRQMGLLEGIRVVRSSDPDVRRAACSISDFFVDVPYEGEVVRARCVDGSLSIHEGGERHTPISCAGYGKEHISPSRDSRLRWMQSVVQCTHYIAGAGEKDYLKTEDAPEINFVSRDPIDRHDEAYVEIQ